MKRLFYILRLSTFAIVVFVLILWAVGAYSGYRGVKKILYPDRNIFCCDKPSDAGFPYEEVTLETQDGLQLVGWYLTPTVDTSIIIAHGVSGNRAGHWGLATELAKEGYGVLMLDLRAHGASEGDIFTQGWLDILAGVDYLQQSGVENIVVYGFSLGANMVVQAAAEDERIDVIIADGLSPVTFSDYLFPDTPMGILYIAYDLVYWWQLDQQSEETGGFALRSTHEALQKIESRPIFLIGAGGEPSGFEEQNVTSYYEVSGSNKELWIIDDVYHGGGFDRNPDAYLYHPCT